MVRSSSINPAFTTTVGLCIANAFTALVRLSARAVAEVGQHRHRHRHGDHRAGLAADRRQLPRPRRHLHCAPSAWCWASIMFRLVYTVALRFDMPAFMLKLVSSVIVVLAISGPYLKKQLAGSSRRRDAQRRKADVRRMLKLTQYFQDLSIPARSTRNARCSDLSLSVPDGDFVTIIGANGAGKSTLFRRHRRQLSDGQRTRSCSTGRT